MIADLNGRIDRQDETIGKSSLVTRTPPLGRVQELDDGSLKASGPVSSEADKI